MMFSVATTHYVALIPTTNNLLIKNSDNISFTLYSCICILYACTDAPVVINPPVDQVTINNGSSIMFVCEANASSEHTLSWAFTNSTGTVTEIVNDGSKYSFVANHSTTRFGELTVMNVDYEDRGLYTCTATNSIGSNRASANLTVHGECTAILLLDYTCL